MSLQTKLTHARETLTSQLEALRTERDQLFKAEMTDADYATYEDLGSTVRYLAFSLDHLDAAIRSSEKK